MKNLIKQAELLTEEMLPYIQKFKDKLFVVKYGGNAMKSEELKKSVMKDIALLKTLGIKVIIVHGGGPNITEEMQKAGIEPKFVNGLRVTDEATVKIVEKTSREINDEIRDILKGFNADSENIENTLVAEQKNKELGLVGEVVNVKLRKIKRALKKDKIPVISPLGISKNKKVKYNINADTAAVKVAVALNAEKFTLLTDVDGVLNNEELIPHLSIEEAHNLIETGIINKGMIPKVEACVEAVQVGVGKAHLINGTISHSLLFEIFTEKGIGTEIVKNGIK